MKKYWPIMGTVGLAAMVGSYAYVNHDPLYQESETEGFLEEEIEYEVELPEEKETPAPHTTKKKEKKQKQNRYNGKETKSNQPYHSTLPRPSQLEQAAEEDEERPPYDLPQEERDKLTDRQLLDYWGESLNNLDYKVAETYSSDLKKRYESRGKESGWDECNISDTYDRDLSDMIENCKKYDYNSVFRKVMWMNVFFMPKYEKSIPNCEIHVYGDGPYHIKKFDPITLINKGNQALEAIEYCKHE